MNQIEIFIDSFEECLSKINNRNTPMEMLMPLSEPFTALEDYSVSFKVEASHLHIKLTMISEFHAGEVVTLLITPLGKIEIFYFVGLRNDNLDVLESSKAIIAESCAMALLAHLRTHYLKHNHFETLIGTMDRLLSA